MAEDGGTPGDGAEERDAPEGTDDAVDDDQPGGPTAGKRGDEHSDPLGDQTVESTDDQTDEPVADQADEPAVDRADDSASETATGPTEDRTVEDDPGEERPDGDAPADGQTADAPLAPDDDLPADVRRYDRFTKMDGAQYERVNEFLRERTHITAREWAIARLCADFRTETGVEMTKIGENLPHLVPFMTDEYSPQAVNQARAAFEQKVRKAGATFLYGAMCDFLTADELDDVMYEATEVAKFLLEVEGVDLTVEEELEAEERISSVMREVRRSSDALRHEGVECPHCGNEFTPEDGDQQAADGEHDHGDDTDDLADGTDDVAPDTDREGDELEEASGDASGDQAALSPRD